MTDEQKADNIKSLALSLRVECPCLSEETSQKVAADLINSDEGGEHWECSPRDHAVIVGKDALGFVHNATHLMGSKDGQWVEMWKFVSI